MQFEDEVFKRATAAAAGKMKKRRAARESSSAGAGASSATAQVEAGASASADFQVPKEAPAALPVEQQKSPANPPPSVEVSAPVTPKSSEHGQNLPPETSSPPASPTAPPRPEAEPSLPPREPPPPVAPKTLDQARAEYLSAKKKVEDCTSSLGMLKRVASKSSKGYLESALEKARTEYAEAIAEFGEAAATKLVEEQMRMVDERTAQYEKTGWDFRWMYDKYKALGNRNLIAFLEWHGHHIDSKILRIAGGMINWRTAITTAMLGVGLYAGATTVAGMGILHARRWIGGLGAGGGLYEGSQLGQRLFERWRAGKKDLSSLPKDERLQALVELTSAIEAKAFLDGQGQKYLQHDGLYQQLVEQRDALLKDEDLYKFVVTNPGGAITPGEKREMSPQELAERMPRLIEEKLKMADEAGAKKFGSERNFRRGALVASAAAGFLVGHGEAAKAINATGSWVGRGWVGRGAKNAYGWITEKFQSTGQAAGQGGVLKGNLGRWGSAPAEINRPKVEVSTEKNLPTQGGAKPLPEAGGGASSELQKQLGQERLKIGQLKQQLEQAAQDRARLTTQIQELQNQAGKGGSITAEQVKGLQTQLEQAKTDFTRQLALEKANETNLQKALETAKGQIAAKESAVTNLQKTLDAQTGKQSEQVKNLTKALQEAQHQAETAKSSAARLQEQLTAQKASAEALEEKLKLAQKQVETLSKNAPSSPPAEAVKPRPAPPQAEAQKTGAAKPATAPAETGKVKPTVETKSAPLSSSGKMPEGAVRMPGKAWAEVQAGEAEIKAGQRGIEGALIDLKRNAETKPIYDKMMAWLKNNPEFLRKGAQANTDDKLIHRFIIKFADDNDFSVGDGKEGDLNRLFKAGIHIGKDGSIDINPEGLGFLSEKAAPVLPVEPAVKAPANFSNFSAPEPMVVMQPGGNLVKNLADPTVWLGHHDILQGQAGHGSKLGLENIIEQQKKLGTLGGKIIKNNLDVKTPGKPVSLSPGEAAGKAGVGATDTAGKVKPGVGVERAATYSGGGGGGAGGGGGEKVLSKSVSVAAEKSGGGGGQAEANARVDRQVLEQSKKNLEQIQEDIKAGKVRDEEFQRHSDAMLKQMSEMRERQNYLDALDNPSLAGGLERVLRDQYKEFLNLMNVSPEALNNSGVGNMSVMAFVEKCDGDKSFRQTFLGVAGFVKNIIEGSNNPYFESDEFGQKTTMKELLLRFAPAYMKDRAS